MKRRKPRKSLTVSLFPFLAVLICTLGVLIVLLVLAVKSAEVQAVEDREVIEATNRSNKAELVQLQTAVDEHEILQEALSSARPDMVARLSEARERRGHLEAELRKLKKQAYDLGQSLLSLEKIESASPELDERTRKIEELKQKILLAEKTLEEKKEAKGQVSARMTYSIVPYAGSGGTNRRPIFLECDRAGVTMQPLGIRFTKDDFVPPPGPGNPLDAAVLAIREYWQKHDVQGSEGSPYPLIVIRPEGAEGYAICRRAMSSWEDEFGYELVERDKELDFGSVDEELKKVVLESVEEAKRRQKTMSAARPLRPTHISGSQTGSLAGANFGRGGSGSSYARTPGLSASSSSGGFVIDGGQYDSDVPQGGSAGGFTYGSTTEVAHNGEEKQSVFASKNIGSGSGNSGNQSDIQPNAGENSNSGAKDVRLSGRGANHLASTNGFQSGGQHGESQNGDANGQAGTSASHQDSMASQGNRVGQSSESGNGECADGSCPPSLMYQQNNLAKTKGKNWAVPNKARGATAYVRPIRVVCTADELEIRSALGVDKTIPINGDVQQTIDPLVNEIWKQIESWGMPGERSYWKPELRISVVAGGELNFEKLQGLLYESGIQIKAAQ